MVVSIEEIKALREKLAEINRVDLESITFTENGEVVKIDQRYIDEWKYIGLNNVDFILMEFHKHGFSSKEC